MGSGGEAAATRVVGDDGAAWLPKRHGTCALCVALGGAGLTGPGDVGSLPGISSRGCCAHAIAAANQLG